MGITTAIENTQKIINDYDVKIEKKRKILNTCDFLKEECDKICPSDGFP